MGLIQKVIDAEGGDNFKYLMEKENKSFGKILWELALKHGFVKPEQERVFWTGLRVTLNEAIKLKIRLN